MSSLRLFRLVVPACALSLALGVGPPVRGQVASSISTNFNPTTIDAGSSIWFGSVLNLSNTAPSTPFSIFFRDVTVQSSDSPLTINKTLPNVEIDVNARVTQATTTYNPGTNTWVTQVPSSFGPTSANIFLDGLGLPVTSTIDPSKSGFNPVTIGGVFSSTANVRFLWQWGAAVFTSFGTDNNSLGVKPTDGNAINYTNTLFQNSDRAGTPENFKAFVTAGGTFGEPSNFTGSYSPPAIVSLESTPEPGPFIGAGVVTLIALGYSWLRRRRATA
jgi:MYXO-CTERM domain-containing protein